MLKFPKVLTFSKQDVQEANRWAEEFKTKNSEQGAVYGRLCELALFKELVKRGHNVSLNDGKNMFDLFWDLDVDGVKVDVKSTKANSFTFSRAVQESLYDGTEKIFACYSFDENCFNLVGVLSKEDVTRNMRTSNFGDGYYIMKYVVKANGRQSLS